MLVTQAAPRQDNLRILCALSDFAPSTVQDNQKFETCECTKAMEKLRSSEVQTSLGLGSQAVCSGCRAMDRRGKCWGS